MTREHLFNPAHGEAEGLSISIPPLLAEPFVSREELSQTLYELLAVLLLRQRKVTCDIVEKALGLPIGGALNLFVKYRMEHTPDVSLTNDDLCRWAS